MATHFIAGWYLRSNGAPRRNALNPSSGEAVGEVPSRMVVPVVRVNSIEEAIEWWSSIPRS